MNTNRTLKQAFIDSRPAQEAWLANKPIQFQDLRNDTPVWTNYDEHTGATPYFAAPFYIWRPKPEPEKVPFTQLTVPAYAWFRFSDQTQMCRIITLNEKTVRFGKDFLCRYEYLAEHAKYSHDRINWKPCYELKS